MSSQQSHHLEPGVAWKQSFHYCHLSFNVCYEAKKKTDCRSQERLFASFASSSSSQHCIDHRLRLAICSISLFHPAFLSMLSSTVKLSSGLHNCFSPSVVTAS